MGRQAHLTRLALGRSPYGPPLRDENGDLVLGPHAHDDDAQGYVQQSNHTGHPTSKATDIQNRRIRRAQNEVLKLAGVVRSKHDEPRPDLWKEMPNEKREDTIKDENQLMRLVRPFDNLIMDLVTSWIYAFRDRLMTYESYLRPPLFSMLRSESGILGLRETLFSGLPLSLFVALSRRRRTWLYSFDACRISLQTPRSKYRQANTLWLWKRSTYLWELLWIALEYPYSACATLQALHLIPSTFLLSPHTLMSIISVLLIDQAPNLPKPLTLNNFATFSISCITHPFVLSHLFDEIRESLQSGLYAIIRYRIPLPDEPDAISENYSINSHAFQHDDDLLRASIPGLGWDVDAKRRYYGPKSFSEALRMAFPGISKVFHLFTGFPPPVRPHLTPANEEALKALCDLRYGVLWRENRQFTEAQRLPDSVVRRRAVEEALSRAGVDAAVDAISVDDWSSRWIEDRPNEHSTTTPDPQDLFPATEVNEITFTSGPLLREAQSSGAEATRLPTSTELIQEILGARADARSPIMGGSGNTAANLEGVALPVATETEQFQPTMPLQTLLLPLNPEGQALPPTPTPGISRALSLDQAPLRPVRRPTDIGADSLSDIVSFSSRPFEIAGLPEVVVEEPDDPVQHRVTLLSNYPAEIFALHTSTLLTSLFMLPFDMYYERSLARTFLGSSRVANPAARRILDDVWPTSPWLGINAMGLRGGYLFVRSLALTFGMQALVSSIVWQGVKQSVLYLGRGYGWGRI